MNKRNEYPFDVNFVENKITRVERGAHDNIWEVHVDAGFIEVEPPSNFIPQAGMTIRTYPKKMNDVTYGCFIDGVEMFYKPELIKQKNCPECGVGIIKHFARPGRTYELEGVLRDIPAEIELQECTHCGEMPMTFDDVVTVENAILAKNNS